MTLKNVRISKKEKEILRPRQPVSPVDFVKCLRLPQKGNILPEIDLTLTPYIVDPIRNIADYSVETIIIIAPTQSGKTVVLQTAVGWSIDQDPGPLMYIYPTELTAKKAMNEKLIEMIKHTPCLQKRIKKIREVSKSGINLDSMTIYPAWSNSPGSINILPMKRVIWDETRLMTLTIGRESNAIKLGEDRMTSYRDLGIAQGIMVSSPSVEGDILFQQLSVPGTLELWWHVPCPNCGEYQLLDFFANVKKPENEQAEAICCCKFCNAIFPDTNYKRDWNDKGIYAPREFVIDKDGNVKGGIPKSKRIVYRWDSLVSPFRSFTQIWNEFVNTKDKLHDYKNFIQCWLARFWKDKESKANSEILIRRKGDYVVGQINDKIKVLLGGIDTQDTCLYYVVHGFGVSESKKMESWLVDEGRIDCDINITDAEDLKILVQSHIAGKDYIADNGEHWKTAMIAWDSGGHRTAEVYAASRKIANVVAIKGKNNQSRSIIYSKIEKLFTIRSIEYMDECDELSQTELYHLPKNVSQEFLNHWISKIKVRRPNKKTGEDKPEWITLGAEHLKDASAYSFSCLDIPIRGIGLIRARLRDVSFKYNPAAYVRKNIPQEQTRDIDGSVDDMTRHQQIENQGSDFTNGEEYTW